MPRLSLVQGAQPGASPGWRGKTDHKQRILTRVSWARCGGTLVFMQKGCNSDPGAAAFEHQGHTKRSQHSQRSLRLKAERPIICLQVTLMMMPWLQGSTSGIKAVALLQAFSTSWAGRAHLVCRCITAVLAEGFNTTAAGCRIRWVHIRLPYAQS